MATPIQTDTTCPVCDLTNENLEGLPCSASAEMERFLATLGPSTPDPRGLLADQPTVTVEASPDWSEATPGQVMENFELVQQTLRTLKTVQLASDLSDGEADMLTRVWHD